MRIRRIMGSLLVLMLLILAVLPVFASNTQEGGKLLALTFDDGPGPDTGRLLDALKERGAQATFFMVGERLENNAAYREYLRRMVEEGHQIANHSYSHTNLSKLTPEAIAREITGTEKYLKDAGGEGTYFVRPPEGAYNESVQKTAGAPLVLWSVDPRDWDDRDAETVYNRIVSDAEDGDIILLHDIYPTSIDGAIQAIDALQKQGYEFVTVSELLRRRGITPQNGQVYACAPNKGINLGSEKAPAKPAAKEPVTVQTAPLVNTVTAPEPEPVVQESAVIQPALPRPFALSPGDLARWALLAAFILLVTAALVLSHSKMEQELIVRVPSRYKRATLSRCHAILLHEITQEDTHHA